MTTIINLINLILCWIKQIGAMVLSALVAVINLVFEALGSAVSAFFAAWPIEMPELPTVPAGLTEAIAWIKWSPIPVDAGLAFLLFAVSVWILWMVASWILRWVKAID